MDPANVRTPPSSCAGLRPRARLAAQQGPSPRCLRPTRCATPSMRVSRLLSSRRRVRRSRPPSEHMRARLRKLKASASTSLNTTCFRLSSARSASQPVTWRGAAERRCVRLGCMRPLAGRRAACRGAHAGARRAPCATCACARHTDKRPRHRLWPHLYALACQLLGDHRRLLLRRQAFQADGHRDKASSQQTARDTRRASCCAAARPQVLLAIGCAAPLSAPMLNRWISKSDMTHDTRARPITRITLACSTCQSATRQKRTPSCYQARPRR